MARKRRRDKKEDKERASLLGPLAGKIYDPKSLEKFAGYDADINADKFAQFLARLAKNANGNGKWIVFRGSHSSWMLNPNNLLEVTASDGSELSLDYLSDLGNYDPLWHEVMFTTDSDYFGEYVHVSNRPVDQEEHELGRMRGDF